MIIQRYIVKEIAITLFAVMVVLLLIFFSLRFVRILGDVAEGSLPVEAVFTLLSLQLLKNIGNIIPLAMFFSVLLAFGRLYRDQEMVALTASGIGQATLTRFLMFWMPLIFIINAICTLYLSPWAAGQSDAIKHAAKNRSELSLLAAGRFIESKDGSLIIYVEELSDDQRELQNVFVQSRKSSRKSVLASETGYRYIDEQSGDEFMVMVDGYRYEGEPGQDDYRITQFVKHAVRVEEKAVSAPYLKRSARNSLLLLSSSRLDDLAELQSRIVVPFVTIALMLLAIPMSRVQPREGRYGRLFSAVFIYVIYNGLFGATYNWIGSGVISPWIGMWWLPLLLLLVALGFVLWQTRGQSTWLNDRMPWSREAQA
ncbi:MAG: LPS export ABC transporter permease LptF [Sulfuriflexus sp.]|nr:LPS export ABC transporter permease LptF [Sulfuriflexus sp.]